MQVDLYNGHKMVVVIAVVAGAVNFNNFFRNQTGAYTLFL